VTSYDVIVAGSGLAGTLLAWHLQKSGAHVLLIDDGRPSSTRVAAGIVHPVTGRRLVKTWMCDTFLPVAETTYAACEQDSGASFYRRTDILELLAAPAEINRWTAAAAEPGMERYITAPAPLPYRDRLRAHAAAAVHGGRLDTGRFLDAMSGFLSGCCTVLREAFDPMDFSHRSGSVRYKEDRARCIIFCEGSRGHRNPYWQHLPWQLSKGEVLLLRCPGLQSEHILNRKIFLLPLGDGDYLAGSTYAWDDPDDEPTAAAREYLEAELKKMLTVPFEITGQRAGVRPTVKERRPFIGFHPHYSSVGILNGLGTKGVLSGPWLARHLSDHILNGSPLWPEISASRYLPPSPASPS
jgi:glycine/D-amino acid oxidase-like deaminating enzyme